MATGTKFNLPVLYIIRNKSLIILHYICKSQTILISFPVIYGLVENHFMLPNLDYFTIRLNLDSDVVKM